MSKTRETASDKRKQPRSIRIKVSDFGPISKGEVDLRPLTVFAGPSNTGKSWLATLIYVMDQYLSDTTKSVFRWPLYPKKDPSVRFPEKPAIWLESIGNKEAVPLTNSDRKILATALKADRLEFGTQLLRSFGLTELRHLSREGSNRTARFNFFDEDATRSPATRYQFAITDNDNVALRVDIANQLKLGLFENSQRLLADISHDIQTDDEDTRQVMRFIHHIFSSENSKFAFYLPADRGGVMHAHHTVVSALIQNASRGGLIRNAPLPMLSGILGDFLQNLLNVVQNQQGGMSSWLALRGKELDGARADRLENNVLNGRVEVEKSSVDYPRFTYIPDGWDRPLSLVGVSSMVSELAPVSLYLRHHVREGDLLILEEPEAHLHPAMQVAFLREIAEWVRQGIRVILTTHSEWVLEELANIVATGESDCPEGLPNEDVGLWLFETIDAKNPDKGSTVREILWDPDGVGYDTGFEDVAMALHNEWVNLAGAED